MSRSPRVIEHTSRGGIFGIAVELYREGSGTVAFEPISTEWAKKVEREARQNYTYMSIVLHPSWHHGYDGKVGLVLNFQPGKVHEDSLHQNLESDPDIPDRLPDFASAKNWRGDGNFSITTNLDDAITFHEQLGRMIEQLKSLSEGAHHDNEHVRGPKAA